MPSEPSPEQLSGLATELIEAESTMTLATTDTRSAWAAPVYYVYRRPWFYFFSSPSSRHMEEARNSGQASAAIHAAGRGWEDIRGVQMSGVLRHVAPGPEAARVLRAYIAKFPFVKQLLARINPLSPESFENRFAVRLYAFRPDVVFYTDNRVRFGYRKRVVL